MEYPTRKRNRLIQYDYSTPNAYFVTICTQNRKNLFWANTKSYNSCAYPVPLTSYGKIAQQSICDIPKHYPMVSVDNFTIMPNHIHLLLRIHADHNGRPMAAPTISTVINQTKGIISKRIGFSVWQKGFHDHVVRTDADYQDIWSYIEANPQRWKEDILYSDTLL